jgi:2'-5' RNA ligase
VRRTILAIFWYPTCVRLFVAITLPADLKHRIARLQQDARTQAHHVQAELKWVKPEQFHLTLKFLGECSEDQLPAIGSALREAAAAAASFNLSVGGLGGFPDVGSMKILWLGLLQGTAEISALADRVNTALEKAGFPEETKKFHPHLTLARPKESKNMHKLRVWMEQQSKQPLGDVTVDSITLIQSVLSPAGPTYTELKRFDLGA